MEFERGLALAKLSAALVARSSAWFERLVIELRESGADREALREVILQSYLHDGYATALEGMAQLDSHWPGETTPIETGEYSMHEQWEERGRRLFEEIYGDVSARVEANARELSPELALWMIVEGYGKVLSRGVLTTYERELGTTAVLILKRRPRQLFSHIRGCLRTGVSPNTLKRLIEFVSAELALTGAAKEASALLEEATQ
jgi:alkylhydroperoxidase/carboxymuconolactone decarboxylase family protein YurZ